jgi:hypothetical protein
LELGGKTLITQKLRHKTYPERCLSSSLCDELSGFIDQLIKNEYQTIEVVPDKFLRMQVKIYFLQALPHDQSLF